MKYNLMSHPFSIAHAGIKILINARSGRIDELNAI